MPVERRSVGTRHTPHLGTFASALAVVVVLLSLALPEFRSAIEGPFEALLPGIVDFGRESGCPPHALALTLT